MGSGLATLFCLQEADVKGVPGVSSFELYSHCAVSASPMFIVLSVTLTLFQGRSLSFSFKF